MKRISLAFLLSLALGASAADTAPGTISYYKDIRPIFQQHCTGCHQPAKPLGGYVMTGHADLFKAGDSEKPGVIAKDPAKSLLVQLLGEVKGRATMPKGKEPLPEPQIKLIRDWVAQGAIDDTPASAKAPLVDDTHPPIYERLPVINAVAYSPDGQLLAVSGYHEVLLHKGDGSAIVGRLIGLSERIQSLAFSPDGKTLAVSGGDPGRLGEIQLWDVEKKKLRISIPVSFDIVYGVSWAPDGSKVACGCADNTIRAFDAKDGKQLLFQGAHADWVVGTIFSQDGQHIASISRDRSMKLTEVPTNRFVDNITSITPGALKGGLLALDLRPLPDLTIKQVAQLVAGFAQPVNGRINPALLANSFTPAKHRLQSVPRDTPGVPPKPYDELLIAGADGQPRLYMMHRESKRVIGDDSNKVREYEALPGRVYAVAFNKKGTQFVAGSSLDGVGEARVYDVKSAKRLSTFEAVKTPVYTVAFHPQGDVVATGGFDGKVRLSEAATGKLIKEFDPVPLKK